MIFTREEIHIKLSLLFFSLFFLCSCASQMDIVYLNRQLNALNRMVQRLEPTETNLNFHERIIALKAELKKNWKSNADIVQINNQVNELYQAIRSYKPAADPGHPAGILFLFNSYYEGRGHTPKNRRKAEEYLQKAADAGAEWAMLIVARRLEETEPGRAIDIYKKVARHNNCFAQARLADAYYNGDITAPNLTLAYFWLLLAKVDFAFRKSGYHRLAGLVKDRYASKGTKGCSWATSGMNIESDLESKLPPKYIALAQDAATNWRKGQKEPSLPSPPVAWARPKEKLRPTGEPLKSYSVQMPKWTPLLVSAKKPSLEAPMKSTKLFEEISRSVWLVISAQSENDLKRGKGAIGSATAITQTQLLTNCHVIENRTLVLLKKGKQIERAKVTATDITTDRCVLTTNKAILEPVKGIRNYNDLSVGEQVYTIGSPSGLESTMGMGIISGLRRLDRMALIQTNAQISRGSSGGGLFDHSGNLIGVTTFMIDDAQGLNFAIPVDDYFR